MPVDRCVCHSVPLAIALDEARRVAAERVEASMPPLNEDQMVAEIALRTGATTGCGMCEPYVRKALRTGHAVLPVMPPTATTRDRRD